MPHRRRGRRGVFEAPVEPGWPAGRRGGPPSESVDSTDSGSEFAYTRHCESVGAAPLLRPGDKVTVADVASCRLGDYQVPNCTHGDRGKVSCLVGTNRLTACTNGKHGFVIQPSGSRTF